MNKIIIIGAGIAGLSAGCYGQMNGYRTQIYELHNKPGGLCTSWQRKGYTINSSLHWLGGSGPGTNFYRIWEELGAVQGRKMIDHEEFIRIEGTDGKVFVVYTDVDRLEQHMKDLAPEDKDLIEEFINGVRTFTRFDMPIDKAPELYGPIDGLKMMFKMFPFLRAMIKWKRITTKDFAAQFKNPFLREAFSHVFGDFFPDSPMIFMLINLAWMHLKSAGYPVGGSLEFARAIERRYLDLGGEIHYSSRVTKIMVEDDRAVGVRLEDGSEHRADYVISAADGYTTIFDMLDGKYTDQKIRGYYDSLPIFPPLIHVALGLDRSFEDLPHSVAGIDYPLDEPVTIAEKEHKRLGVQIYNFDSTLAPPGKTVMTVMFYSDYDYWRSLQEDPNHYKAEKEQIAEKVVALLDRRFPGLADQVEMSDVATPITYNRYTGNWQGSYEGWLITTKTFGMRMSKTLPGLANFYMCGQWVEPGGGVPIVALSGRNVIQLICKRDKKPFATKIP